MNRTFNLLALVFTVFMLLLSAVAFAFLDLPRMDQLKEERTYQFPSIGRKDKESTEFMWAGLPINQAPIGEFLGERADILVEEDVNTIKADLAFGRIDLIYKEPGDSELTIAYSKEYEDALDFVEEDGVYMISTNEEYKKDREFIKEPKDLMIKIYLPYAKKIDLDINIDNGIVKSMTEYDPRMLDENLPNMNIKVGNGKISLDNKFDELKAKLANGEVLVDFNKHGGADIEVELGSIIIHNFDRSYQSLRVDNELGNTLYNGERIKEMTSTSNEKAIKVKMNMGDVVIYDGEGI